MFTDSDQEPQESFDDKNEIKKYLFRLKKASQRAKVLIA